MNAKSEVTFIEYFRGLFNIYKIKLFFLLTLSKNLSFHSVINLIKAILGKKYVLLIFKNGSNLKINREEIFTTLWYFFDKMTIDIRIKKVQTTLDIQIHNNDGKRFLQLSYLNENIQFSYNSDDILLTILMALEVTFIQRKWKVIECKDNIIVDVGGNIGDTGVFFYLNGARKVITIEPFPSLFEILKDVVNNLKNDNIVPINNTFEGFVEGHSFKPIKSEVNPYFGSNFREHETSYLDDFPGIEDSSSDELLNCDNYHDKCILKLSCAGCEYYLVNLSKEYLRKFKQIVVEYNYGYRSICNKLLKSGFHVTHSKPIGVFGRSLKDHNVFLGMIIAVRQD